MLSEAVSGIRSEHSFSPAPPPPLPPSPSLSLVKLNFDCLRQNLTTSTRFSYSKINMILLSKTIGILPPFLSRNFLTSFLTNRLYTSNIHGFRSFSKFKITNNIQNAFLLFIKLVDSYFFFFVLN